MESVSHDSTNTNNATWHIIGLADEGKGNGNSFFFSRDDLLKSLQEDRLRNILVYLEHGDATKENMGKVVYSWLDENDGLYVMICFNECPRSRALRNWITNGVYTGLSLGYNSTYDQNYNVLDKRIFEISIVNKPFHPKCRIKQIIHGGRIKRIDDVLSNLSKPHYSQNSSRDFGEQLYKTMTRDS